MNLRKEFDSIGSINVPNDKYWGASTQRSNKFFNIGKILVNISIIKSIAIIKRSKLSHLLALIRSIVLDMI
jgi:fumarate hydratase class II